MTLICVPIMVEGVDEAIRDAIQAAELGADLIEYRVDILFEARDETTDPLETRIDRVQNLVERSPIPCIVTCRPHWEGGEYHGDDDERISLYQALGTSDHPPAYIDVELATYTRSANIKQKINLAVDHPNQQRSVSTRLILSTHDFSGRPADLTRKVLTMNDEPVCAVVKIAYRARSIRDNLELFEILRDRHKPTIALAMGEFGQMSRILAPKFGGFLTFASLRDESTTAPGQTTIHDLINLYRFRSITRSTKVYGIMGWPITQSMSPLVHNAGFDNIDWDGVYVPMPIEESYESFKATTISLIDSDILDFAGASVTIPHKEHLTRFISETTNTTTNTTTDTLNAHNTLSVHAGSENQECSIANTDSIAIQNLLQAHSSNDSPRILIVGAGGVASAALHACSNINAQITVTNRTLDRATDLINQHKDAAQAVPLEDAFNSPYDIYINCTPIGMTDGPDPDGLSIPINELSSIPQNAVFFDTVYNPIETPMLKAAHEREYQTIEGVEMFVHQAHAQFTDWTSQTPPDGLFDTLVRQKLSPQPS